jgi:hypothetical protein
MTELILGTKKGLFVLRDSDGAASNGDPAEHPFPARTHGDLCSCPVLDLRIMILSPRAWSNSSSSTSSATSSERRRAAANPEQQQRPAAAAASVEVAIGWSSRSSGVEPKQEEALVNRALWLKLESNLVAIGLAVGPARR